MVLKCWVSCWLAWQFLICMLNSWLCCIIIYYCQFNLLPCLAHKTSLSFWGAVGGPLDAACHGHSETLVFALIRWMVDEKSSITVSLEYCSREWSQTFHFFAAFHETSKSGYFYQIQNTLFRLDCKYGFWFMARLLAWQAILFWQITISSLSLRRGSGCL